jgi:hypothetical protein
VWRPQLFFIKKATGFLIEKPSKPLLCQWGRFFFTYRRKFVPHRLRTPNVWGCRRSSSTSWSSILLASMSIWIVQVSCIDVFSQFPYTPWDQRGSKLHSAPVYIFFCKRSIYRWSILRLNKLTQAITKLIWQLAVNEIMYHDDSWTSRVEHT